MQFLMEDIIHKLCGLNESYYDYIKQISRRDSKCENLIDKRTCCKGCYEFSDIRYGEAIKVSFAEGFGWPIKLFNAYEPQVDFLYSLISQMFREEKPDLSKYKDEIDREMFKSFSDLEFIRRFVLATIPGYNELYYLEYKSEQAEKEVIKVLMDEGYDPFSKVRQDLSNSINCLHMVMKNYQSFTGKVPAYPMAESASHVFSMSEVRQALQYCYENKRSSLYISRAFTHLRQIAGKGRV